MILTRRLTPSLWLLNKAGSLPLRSPAWRLGDPPDEPRLNAGRRFALLPVVLVTPGVSGLEIIPSPVITIDA